MKKLKIVLFIFVILLCSGCSDMVGQLTCAHEFELTDETPATCTKTGLEVYECSLCGKTKKEKIEKLDHDYKKDSVVVATCKNDGYTLLVCKDCGLESKTDVITKTPHNYNSEVVIPTCTEEGYTVKTCKDCGEVEKGNFVDAYGHKFGSWQTKEEPTEISEGLKVRECSRCGFIEKQTITSNTYVDLTYIKEAFDNNKTYESNDYEELSFRFNCAIANLSNKLVCSVYEIDDFNKLLNDLVNDCDLPYSFNLNASLTGNELTLTFEYIGNPIYKTSNISYTQLQSLNYKSTISSRSDDFDDFKINQSMYQFNVTTTDTLFYALERGAKPIIAKGSASEIIYEEIKDVLREIIDDNMTDSQKVTAIYEWLIMNVTYDEELLELLYDGASGLNRYNGFYLEGVFLDKKAVCEGISKAFTAMCNIEGIRCVTVEGYQTKNPNGAGHAWNKVYVDGSWYIVDATSGGTILGGEYEVLTYDFLLISEEIYQKEYIGETYTELTCNKVYDIYSTKEFEYNNEKYDFIINSQQELNTVVEYLYSVKDNQVTIEFKPDFNYGNSLLDEIEKAMKNNNIYGSYSYIESDNSFMLIRK